MAHPYGEPRLEGYRRGLSEARIAYAPELVADVTRMNVLLQDGRDRARDILRAHPVLAAIVATAGAIVIGVMRAAREVGGFPTISRLLASTIF